jgi:glyoxylase-like metal-dependent hydrolase (beta-lactamase superfamily II)/rhodanese-related sulfurtransferase
LNIEKYYLECLSHASYVLYSGQEAAIVDPQRDVEMYIEYLKDNNLTLKYILETHLHADFVSGHIELAERTGAGIVFGEKAQAKFDHKPVVDGEVLSLGEYEVKILETPGHTPESICYLVQDTRDNSEPMAIFTGDTLFAGDVGRPDLLDGTISPEQLGGMLYDSLHGKLLPLPDNTKVYPAHGAGSACGRELLDVEYTTIGDEKKNNYALQPMSKAEFIQTVTADQPIPPKYFVLSAELNKFGLRSTESILENFKSISLANFHQLRDQEDVIVLDVRDPEDYSRSHIPGSYNIGLDGRYAEWVGSIVDHQKSILLVADIGTEREAAIRCMRVGFDNVIGYLEGGYETWLSTGETESLQRHTSQQLDNLINSKETITILDVRRKAEHKISHFPQAKHIPLNQLEGRLSELSKDKPIIVHCAGGYRSVIAASILKRNGFTGISDLQGGFDEYLQFHTSSLSSNQIIEPSQN